MASTVSKILKCNSSVRLAKDGSLETGAGADERLPIGIYSADGRRHRFAAQPAGGFPGGFFTGMAGVVDILFWVYQVDFFRVDSGSNPRLRVRRCTASWNEGSNANLNTGNSTIWPGPAKTATNEIRSPVLSNGQGWKHFSILALGMDWVPVALGGTNNAMRGVLVAQDNDDWTNAPGYSGTAANGEYASDDWGSGTRTPYFEFIMTDNHAPAAPTISTPVSSGGGGAPVNVASRGATTLPIDYLFSDPDSGDTLHDAQVQAYTDAATDAVPGTVLGDLTGFYQAAGGTDHWLTSVGILTPRTIERYRLRTKDETTWGPWSPLDNGRVFGVYLARKPANPYMQSTPDAPHIFGSIDSDDPADYVTGWEGEFYRDDPTGTVTLWAAGPQDIGGTPTRSDVTWGGAALSVGDTVRWRHRHYNRDGQAGDWSPFYTTPMLAQTGPTTMSPLDASTKLLTRTPTFTIGNAAFDKYRWRIYRNLAIVYDSGTVSVGSTTSVTPTVPAGILNWGDGAAGEMAWDAAVEPTGNSVLDPYSPLRPFRIDSLPSTTIAASA
jgi:hypothetical protein